MLTAEIVRKLLNYNTDTGILTWRLPRSGVAAGAIAGTIGAYGYRYVRVCGRLYYAHRIIWLYIYENWPVGQIDHINGKKDDNRLINLREANSVENGRNCGKSSNNTSGVVGVSWHKQHEIWCARIKILGKYQHLGYFRIFEEAVTARHTAEAKYFGEFQYQASKPKIADSKTSQTV